MSEFKVGDKVKRKDGLPFTSDIYISEVFPQSSSTRIWVTHSKYLFKASELEKVSDTMSGVIELNGVKYQVENIPGKGDCLVPVKRTPKTGEVWQGPKGGIYVVTAFNESEGYELLGNMVYTIPQTAKFVAKNVREAIQKGLIK